MTISALHPIQSLSGLLAGIALTFLAGCSLYGPTDTSKTLVKGCVLPNDQTATISGKWSAVPIPISFFQGAFDTTETDAIVKAATSWNDFFKASKGHEKVLDFGDATAPRTTTVPSTSQNNLCSQGIILGNTFNGNVVIYKQSRWPAKAAPTAMAVTYFCKIDNKPYPKMYMALIEINYQNYFVEGTRQPHLQSIIAHEFGHLLGLNHTCTVDSKTAGNPDCNNPNIDPEYLKAVMYYTFSFTQDIGEQRYELGTNDQGRANCLY